MRKQGYVARHDEEVQGRELRGKRRLGVKHGSHRDEEARELDCQATLFLYSDSDVDATGNRRDDTVTGHRRGC